MIGEGKEMKLHELHYETKGSVLGGRVCGEELLLKFAMLPKCPEGIFLVMCDPSMNEL
jgi:hypothetical protein